MWPDPPLSRDERVLIASVLLGTAVLVALGVLSQIGG
jgi:hypothetical protein